MKKRISLLLPGIIMVALTLSGCCCPRAGAERGCCGYQSCDKMQDREGRTGGQLQGKPCCPQAPAEKPEGGTESSVTGLPAARDV